MSLNRPWLRWWVLSLVWLFCNLYGAGQAHAQNHITERAWLEDPTGQLTWPEVQQRPSQAFKETVNRGYGTGAVWLRLRIDPRAGLAPAPPGQENEHLVLRIRPAYLDDIQLFDPLEPGGHAGTVGDRHHPRHDLMQGTDFLLPIARGVAPRDIWLRLTSTSTRQIHVEALSPGELEAVTMRQNLLSSLYMGAVLLMFVWGIVNYLLRREPIMGLFALMQLTASLFGLSSLGILRVFWPLAWSADALSMAGSVFSVAVVGCGVLFHIGFLRELRPPVWAMGGLYALLAWVVVNLALLAGGWEMWALQNNIWILLLAPPVSLVCVWTARSFHPADAGERPAIKHGVLMAFYALFCLILVIAASSALGWGQARQWTIYISLSHGLVTSVLLMVMLQYRAHVLERQRQQAQLALEKTTLQVTHERQMREEQEKLLTMLAHEIKTPLATMHLRLDVQSKSGQEIRKAMRDMNSVIERCIQTLQMGDGRLTAHMRWHDVVHGVREAVSACSERERVRTDLPRSLHTHTDPQLLFIVLSNLLENACRYSLSGSPIELRVAVQPSPSAVSEGVVRLELNNLPGVAGWPDPDHVFDKYYRAPKAQRQSGTGLGLYLVKSLMQSLEGEIVYQPDETMVRFVVTLPLRPANHSTVLA